MASSVDAEFRRLDRAREKLERQLEEVAVEIDQDEEAADAAAAAADAAAQAALVAAQHASRVAKRLRVRQQKERRLRLLLRWSRRSRQNGRLLFGRVVLLVTFPRLWMRGLCRTCLAGLAVTWQPLMAWFPGRLLWISFRCL
ncbi:hypothetical protein DBV05_g8927 [Lasiodiplodia theobromae]|uniref:Uncharacterized protein n=1 Tax=Lasiodiplodia theobromae TaxID=45133 RepID=A0A5N5D3X5_9PEZI|nr:hypothetical protein DBV05_g8927 [Lasiodiplodia theobromae]